MQFIDLQSVVEWRATRIQDPVERLRYLQRAVPRLQRPLTLDEYGPAWLRAGRPRSLTLAGLVFVLMALASGYTAARGRQIPLAHPDSPAPPPAAWNAAENPAGVWRIDQQGDTEIFSNGLRIDNRFAVSNAPRKSYRIFERQHPDIHHVHWKDQPAGLIYHTTESDVGAFSEGQNKKLQRIGLEVAQFVRRNHSYHFLIDRFGRVFRIVQESDIAYHAGNSVWGDESNVYLNLNSSFLGIAFESRTRQAGDARLATQAQIDSARVLTEMLRAKYRLAAADCVTHAQVSVNRVNMLIGYHTDWADRFPFAALGLKDNYAEPPASLSAFGFEYDEDFIQATGSRFLPGLFLAEYQVKVQAANLKLSVPVYKALLQKNYQELTAAAYHREPAKETMNEQQ